MAIVTYRNESYECSKAIKGSDYIHLLDADGRMIVAFDKVINFSVFAISGGSWVAPTPDDSCNVAVVRDDGTVVPGSHKCSDILPTDKYSITLTSSNMHVHDSSGYAYFVSIAGLTPNDLAVANPTSNVDWAFDNIQIAPTTDTLQIIAGTLPSSECTIEVFIIRSRETA